MVQLSIRTSGLDKIQRKLAREAVTFVCKKFLSRMKYLEFRIKGLDLDQEHIFGDCMWDDDNFRPREFTIRVDNTIDFQRFLETIMHEMVHVKQYAKGELGWLSKSNTTKWKGRSVSRRMSYFDHPWEIEAHGREYGLTEEFLIENKKWVKYVKEGATDYKLCGSSQMVLPFDR
jgi:hypothetical protein